MATMNRSGESARKSTESIGKSTQQTTEPQESKGVGYDSPLEVLVAAIDAVVTQIRDTVTGTRSQRHAAFALWTLQTVADAVNAWADSPDHAHHPRKLERIREDVAKRAVADGLHRTRKRRRSKELAPSDPDVLLILGGSIRDGDTWSPAPAVTEKSGHKEHLRGVNNLHRFLCTLATNNPERAKTVLREYARVVATVLGATQIEWSDGEGNVMRGSQQALRNWDVLKTPRTPAPGLLLPCKAAPIFDVHSVLDTGELQISLIAHHIAAGTYDDFVQGLQSFAEQHAIPFQKAYETFAFAKISLVDENGAPVPSTEVFHYRAKPDTSTDPPESPKSRDPKSQSEEA